MTEQNVKYKTLLALLYQFQERGLAMFREERERDLCLQAAGLYLVKLSVDVTTPLSPFYLRFCWDFPAAEPSRYSTQFCSASRWTASSWSAN